MSAAHTGSGSGSCTRELGLTLVGVEALPGPGVSCDVGVGAGEDLLLLLLLEVSPKPMPTPAPATISTKATTAAMIKPRLGPDCRRKRTVKLPKARRPAVMCSYLSASSLGGYAVHSAGYTPTTASASGATGSTGLTTVFKRLCCQNCQGVSRCALFRSLRSRNLLPNSTGAQQRCIPCLP
jgi:hypothetical protein